MHDLHASPSPAAHVVDPAAPDRPGHVAVGDGALSSHRTAGGATVYVRCSCGGFLVLGADRHGGWRQLGHAAGPGGRT